MGWTDGIDRAANYVITNVNWNDLLGAAGSLMGLKSHAHGGTTGEGSQSIGPLVLEDFTDAAAPAAPGAGKTRVYAVSGKPKYRAGAAGADTALIDAATTAAGDLAGTYPNPTLAKITLGADADGDMYYRAGGVLARLPKGTASQALFGGTVPVWANLGQVTVLDRILATTTVVSTAAETDLYRKTIGAGALGTTGGLRLFCVGDTLNNTGGAATMRWRVKLGSTTLFDTAALNVGIGAVRYNWTIELEVFNATATNAQRARGTFRLKNLTGDAWSAAFNPDMLGYATAAEDTTSAKDLIVTAQPGTSAAGLDARVELGALEQFA